MFSLLIVTAVSSFACMTSAQRTLIWNCSFGSFSDRPPVQCSIKLDTTEQSVRWFVTFRENNFGESQPYLRATLNNPDVTEGMNTTFVIPTVALPPFGRGILSFRYLFNSQSTTMTTGNNGAFQVYVCNLDGSAEVISLPTTDGWAQKNMLFTTSCADLKISFTAVRGDDYTNAGIDDISIINIPFSSPEPDQSTSIYVAATTVSTLRRTKTQTETSLYSSLTNISSDHLNATSNSETRKDTPAQVLLIASLVVSFAMVCLLCVVIIVFIRRRHRRLFSKQADDVIIPPAITEGDPERPSPMYDTSLLQFRSNGHDEDDNDKQPEYTEMEALSDKDPYQTLTSRPLPSIYQDLKT